MTTVAARPSLQPLLYPAALVLVVAPLGAVLYRGVFDVGAAGVVPTTRHLAKVLSGSIYWTALVNTLVIALGAALVATLLGTALAWIFARTDTIGRGMLEYTSQLPIFIPPFVG